MPRKRLSMRQVHEVLRLKWAVGSVIGRLPGAWA